LSYGRETSHHSAARRLRIGCPLGEREPQRLRELLLGELPRAHRRNLCQDGREQMRAPGAVFHPRAWRIDALAAQHVLHPVLAWHPCAGVAAARGLQARPHGQELGNGDAARERIRILGEFGQVRGRQLFGVLEVSLAARNPNQRADDALRRRLDVRVLRGAWPTASSVGRSCATNA